MSRLDDNHKQKNKIALNVVQTAALMVVFTLCSRFLAFVKQLVLAGYFGTSYVVDAYVMAQAIPSIIFAGIFGAVGTSYIPLLSNKIERGYDSDGNVFTTQVINILFIASIASAGIGLFFSDQLTAIFASGFTGETAELTSTFLKVTFSYTIFSSVEGILSSYLKYKNTFLPQIVIGYVDSIAVICAIIISAHYSYYYLAFGLLVACIIRLVLVFIVSKIRGYRYICHCRETGSVIKDIAILAIPAFIGSSTSQINSFVDKYLASGLAEGSIAALNYASTLNAMITSFTITVLSSMIYPRLAQASATDDDNRFAQLAQSGLTLIIMIALPFSIGAMLYSNEIVQIMFERGNFDIAATSLTGSAYLYYSIGMTFSAINGLFINVYYSKHDMKTPMFISIMCVIINIGLNLILVGNMQHNGLALATSISAICNTILLYIGLRKKFSTVSIIKSKKKFINIIVATVISVGLSYLVYMLLISTIWLPRMVYLGVSVAIAIVVYLLLLKKFKIEELDLLKSLIRKS